MKAIIFDMDGVLVDSVNYVTQSLTDVMKEYGVDLDLEIREKTIGMSLRDQLDFLKKEYDIEEEMNVREISDKSFYIQLELMKGKVKPDENVQELIKTAKEKGYKIAVATSSRKMRAEKFLELVDIPDKLDAFITVEDVDKHKPDPAIFIKAAEKLSLRPEECVIFEDSLSGLQAAKNSGAKVVAMRNKYVGEEKVSELANFAINDFSEIDLEKLENL